MDLLKARFGKDLDWSVKPAAIKNNNGKKLNAGKNFRFEYLRDNLVMKLNQGQPISCFRSSNGALALYDVSPEDVNVLNNLLHFLIHKFNVVDGDGDCTVTSSKELKVNETIFLRQDALTKFFDDKSKQISSLPKSAFTGNVAIKIMGLQFFFGNCNNGESKSHCQVKLLIHLMQVRVMEIKAAAAAAVSSSTSECMFTD